MDISKSEPEKTDSKSKTNISPMPKTPSRISESMESSQSKIPKRGVSSARNISVYKSRMKEQTKPSKPASVNKPSASMMNLNLTKTTTTTLPSSRSCLNSNRSVKTKEETPRLENTDKISDFRKRATSKRNLQQYEAVKEKLQSCQEQFMRKFDLVKDELSKDERDLKLVCLFKNNEGQLIARNQSSKIITTSDKNTLVELKTFLKNFAQKKLEAIDTPEKLTSFPGEIGDTLTEHENFKQIEETKQKLQNEKKTLLNDFINEIESLPANDKLKESTPNKELETKNSFLLNEVNELRKKLEDDQTELSRVKKNSDQKLSTLKKELEEKNKVESKNQLEFDELKKKYDSIEKENLKAKSLNKETGEKLIKKTHEYEDLNQKLKTCAQTNVKIEAKNKESEQKIIDLQLKVDKMKIELNTSANCEKDFIKEQTLKHEDEINSFKNELLNVQKEKEDFAKEVESLRNKMFNLQKIESQFSKLQDELDHANREKQNLNEALRDLKEKLETSQKYASVTRDVQDELIKFQRADTCNNEKIQNLQNELTKAQFQIKKLEEKIVLDGKLLKVRTDLIDSLQAKEKSQKIRLQDLFAEVGEKNNNLQMIKTEVLTKTEEFQKLFSTLSTKQMDITRQEHMIKLLQENNERAQNLRVRQEAKIARLEEEILELKQAISVYQDVVLPNNTLRRNLLIAEACRGDCNDSLGFYIEERRKKRHIDISVKKYEK